MYIYNLGLRFQRIAESHKQKAAIVFCDGNRGMFGELEEFSNKIANFLISQHISKNQVVAIQNEKTCFGFAAMIACLKIGIIYTNFDSANPKERLLKIFDTAQPAFVISDTKMVESVIEICKEKNIPCFNYSDIQEIVLNQSSFLAKDILEKVDGSNSAYIMFTSGSTGIPKGVLIKHESLLNFIDWGKDVYQLNESDIMTNVNPIYFDNSVFDFYCSIFNGITMAAFPKSIVEQPKKMLDIIDEIGCTFWFSVPSFLIYLNNLKLISKDIFKKMRIISFGGEGYPKDLLVKLYEIFKNRISFYNVYGPTEGTCICSAYKIQDSDFQNMHGLITLGKLAKNFDYLILDENNKESTIGELCLMGPQLAIGYYNDAERTKKSFLQNPLNTLFKQKMYKTGDLIEEKNGKLYFVGRADNQIKHMGYRIELEEIEAGLIKLPYVKQCAVIHGKTDKGFSKLVSFIAIDLELEEKKLRNDLRNFLPDYMIPNAFNFMKELPKNANGKVDRIKLKVISGLS